MRLGALTCEILARHSGTLSAAADDIVAHGAKRGAAGVAVIELGSPGGPPWGILKIATTDPGRRLLKRETEALTALHADDRLEGWSELLPHPLAAGVLHNRPYRIDSALRGLPVATKAAVGSNLLSAAAAAISTLHEKTATTIAGGPDLAERWVDGPLREVAGRAGGSHWLADRFESLRDELHPAVTAGRITVAWIHGDYWFGNLLFSGVRGPTGIVDWETSAPLELPFHDVLHLALYTRRLVSGRELGELIREQLGTEDWLAEEQTLLSRCFAFQSCMSLSPRHMLLLYWLRHAAAHARQQKPGVGYRYRLWERRNVLPVLAAL